MCHNGILREVQLTKRFGCIVRAARWTTIVALAAGFALSAELGQAKAGFTIEQALSAPFCSELRAAPVGRKLAWVANIDGRRNLWIAEPQGTGFASRPITHYSNDDGQELSGLAWLPDANAIVYTRGNSPQGEGHPVPNPAWFPLGAKQQIWIVNLSGPEPNPAPRLLAEGHSPEVSPDGKTVAYILKGQVWTVSLTASDAKPVQLVQARGTAGNLRWSPNSASIAFVSDRDDHSFIAVYSFAAHAINYLDASTDFDRSPVWSPDSKRIAFLRIPGDKNALLFVPHRTALPWSIRIADATTGVGREVWKTEEGVGSAYRETDSEDQLHWAAGDRIVFPWEAPTGWLRLWAAPASGGAGKLLTPGDDFEVEHVSMSPDGKTLVLDSNQGDIDRRHVWRVTFDGRGGFTPAQAVTSGEGIETQPVVAMMEPWPCSAPTCARAHARRNRTGRQTHRPCPASYPASFPGAQFVIPQQVIFTAADGLKIHGQLFLPARPQARRAPSRSRVLPRRLASAKCCWAGTTWSTTPTPTR